MSDPAPTGALVGTVRDAEGDALPGVIVTAAGPLEQTRVTDAEGRYSMNGLPAGSYRVAAELEGFETAYDEAAVWPRETTTVDLTLRLAPPEG